MQNIGILNEYKARIFMISRDIENFNLKGNVFYFNCYDTKHRANNILDERLNYLRNLEARKAEVERLIDEQGKLTDELTVAIAAAIVRIKFFFFVFMVLSFLKNEQKEKHLHF